MRRPWTDVLYTLAGLLLALGLVAGVLHRQVLERPIRGACGRGAVVDRLNRVG